MEKKNRPVFSDDLNFDLAPKPSTPKKKAAGGSCCGGGGKEVDFSVGGTPAKADQPGKREASCCGGGGKKKFDWLMWGSLLVCLAAVVVTVFGLAEAGTKLAQFSHSIAMLLKEMWWGLALGMVAVGVLHDVPREFIISLLGKGNGFRGLLRATFAGLLLDLCNHGILLVGMTLYRRGATLGQTMAFLIASPWNSLSLTLILIALIGLPWTLVFIVCSGVIALSAGWMFERLVGKGVLPENPNRIDLPAGFKFWPEAKAAIKRTKWTPGRLGRVLVQGVKQSGMIVRWLLFGTILAALIRVFVPQEFFGQYFGPSVVGLALTLVAATVIEVCSEGSTPIAADLFNRAGAPGNAFTFLMAGAATDYTEIMVLRETTKSWKISLFLPLLTVPQVLLIAYAMNTLGA
ncbi:permease [Sulfuriroseicoccus oceanibius]|uniref:Permease n=1 Tax=Sulfuriroseicoccus oceanibius TaxID=2707525 RepID=A0A7T7JCF5_9BACT|nr:permease [Sulfuriroseicoccus oceanibius]QQL44966.1 permease [Sulfuriroseicoccus oceanibius]